MWKLPYLGGWGIAEIDNCKSKIARGID